MEHKLIRLSLSVAAFALLSGCQLHKSHIVPNDPEYAPVAPQQLVATPSNNGSLYREGFGVSLYDDNIARRVGDIITVELTESMTSDSKSQVKSERETTINSANPTLFGGNPSGISLPGVLSLRGRGESLAIAVDSDNEYDGKGLAKDSHSLKGGFITVTVFEVYPNGNLKIRGEKWISLNEDEKYIRLTGIIRPEDIRENNTISSTKIADARISYGGKGLVSESSAPGWIARFFMSPLWPF